MRRILQTLTIFILLGLPVLLSGQNTWYVDATVESSGNGESWATAKKTIQEAVTIASAGDKVLVADGTYNTGSTAAPGYSLLNRVVIDKAITVESVNGPEATIIEGAPATGGGNGADAIRGVYLAAGATMEGFKIINGYTKSSGPEPEVSGGGLFITGDATADNMIVMNNAARGWGGGVICFNSGTLTNSTISNNTVKGGGGGAALYYGGTMNNCSFNDNSSLYTGGGVYCNNGGIINNAIISGNEAQNEGGGILMNYGGTVNNSLITDNVANGSYGGGVDIEWSGGTLNNCTISGNVVTQSGGSGGGVCFLSSGTLNNCISYFNSADTYNDIDNETFTGGTINYTCASNGLTNGVNGCITAPPLFVDKENGNYQLQTLSPCKDAGNNEDAQGDDDLRGYDRIVNTTIDMGAYEYQGAPGLWTGETSTAWNTASNWDGKNVPTSTMDVTIPTGLSTYPTLSSSGDCKDLTVAIGASLIIASGPSEAGSLITAGSITNSGTVNVEHSLTEDDHWHFISVPNNSTTAGDLFDQMYLQQWVEGDGSETGWQDVIDPETVLTPAKGYSLWIDDGAKMDFTYTGTPNTGDQSIALTANGTGTNKWMNFVGNPYPSYLDWDEVTDYGSKYTWNGTAYLTYTQTGGYGEGSQYVAPMEGFFIYKDAGVADNFSLTNAMRTHQPAGKAGTKALQNGIILEASNGSYNDALWIVFNAEAAEGFELARDAWKIQSGTEGISQLWSVSKDGNLAVDVRPETQTIQLGFANDKAGIYSIGIKEISDIPNATLEDYKTGKFHNLQNGKYEFAWNPETDIESRFKLHLNAVGIGETIISESVILIYAANNQIFIKGAETGQFMVSDMMGRIIIQQKISGLVSIPANLKTGVYVVMVQSGEEIRTEKVFIK